MAFIPLCQQDFRPEQGTNSPAAPEDCNCPLQVCPGVSMQHCPAAPAAIPSHISPAAPNSDGWL